jgi:hypothetical protein
MYPSFPVATNARSDKRVAASVNFYAVSVLIFFLIPFYLQAVQIHLANVVKLLLKGEYVGVPLYH